MIGISYNTDQSLKTETAYLIAGLLLFSAGRLITPKKS